MLHEQRQISFSCISAAKKRAERGKESRGDMVLLKGVVMAACLSMASLISSSGHTPAHPVVRGWLGRGFCFEQHAGLANRDLHSGTLDRFRMRKQSQERGHIGSLETCSFATEMVCSTQLLRSSISLRGGGRTKKVLPDSGGIPSILRICCEFSGADAVHSATR